jgi:sugar/nucleoside kinase (ribokinase family)
MTSYEPPEAGDTSGLARLSDGPRPLSARAVVVLLDQVAQVPNGVPIYAITSHAHASGPLATAELPYVQALIANEFEALGLTGASDAETAAQQLSARAGTAVVTLGARGALAASGGIVEQVPAREVEVLDATGAGDLFAAAYVWADLRRLALRERLCWATLYATLSLSSVTAFAGAVRLPELYAAAGASGLQPPA